MVALFYVAGYFVIALYYNLLGIPSTLASGKILPAGVLPVFIYAAGIWLFLNVAALVGPRDTRTKGSVPWAFLLAELAGATAILSVVEIIYYVESPPPKTMFATDTRAGAVLALVASSVFLVALMSRDKRKPRLAVLGTLAGVATVWTTSTSFTLIYLAIFTLMAVVTAAVVRSLLGDLMRVPDGQTATRTAFRATLMLAGLLPIISLSGYASRIYPGLPPYLGGGRASRVLMRGSIGTTAADSAFFARGLWQRFGDYYLCILVEHAGGQYYIGTSTLKGVNYVAAIPESKVDMVLFSPPGSDQLSDEQFLSLFAGLDTNRPTLKPALEMPPPNSTSPP